MNKRISAQPFDFTFDPATTALIVIDMQRDFVEPNGFGHALGNDVSLVRRAIEPCRKVLDAARAKGMLVIHTREGHRPDLTDCLPAKLVRGGKRFIGEPGAMGRILVQGEAGHDIIPELYPIAGEPVIEADRGLGCHTHDTSLRRIPLGLRDPPGRRERRRRSAAAPRAAPRRACARGWPTARPAGHSGDRPR